MEYNYADQLDLEWQGLIHGYLKAFSFQKSPTLIQFEEALQRIFCPGWKFTFTLKRLYIINMILCVCVIGF